MKTIPSFFCASSIFRCAAFLGFSLAFLMPGRAEVIRQWDFNTLVADFLNTTGTRRPNLGYGAPAYPVGGVGNRFGVVSTVNQPDDPNTLDNSHWRLGQIENSVTGLTEPESGFPVATNGNKTAGVQFPVNTSGYANIRVTWNQENSATASRFWRVQYTLNGMDWLDSATVVTALSADSAGAQSGTPLWQRGLTADFTGIPGVDNNPDFAFRLVSEFEFTATGAGTNAYIANRAGNNYGRAGTLWLDMVTVTGDSIAPFNQWPTVSVIPDQIILTNESSMLLDFTVGDAETAANVLTVTARSHQPGLINIVTLGGANEARTVQVTPEPGAQGTAVIVIQVKDEGGKVTETAFEVGVTVPAIFPIAAQTTTAEEAVTVAVVTTNLPGDPFFEWLLTAGSSDTNVVADAGITFGTPGISNAVTITPVPGAKGSTWISITNQGPRGWKAVQQFEVKVLPPKVVYFDLTGLPSTAGVPSVEPTLSVEGLSAGPLTRGPGIVQAGLGNGFSANNWNNTNSLVNPVVTSRAKALADGEYFEFSVTVNSGFQLSVTSLEMSLRRSAVASPMNYELQYSLDGFATEGLVLTNFSYLGRDSGTAPATLRPFQWMTTDTPGQPNGNPTWPFLLEHIAALQNLPAGTQVTIRLYAWGTGAGADSNTVALGRVNGPALRGVVLPVASGPSLEVRLHQGNVVVSWPVSASDYRLETALSLETGAWSVSELVPSVDGERYVVTIGGATDSRFFRLVR